MHSRCLSSPRAALALSLLFFMRHAGAAAEQHSLPAAIDDKPVSDIIEKAVAHALSSLCDAVHM